MNFMDYKISCMFVTFISEYNQIYRIPTSCYYCLGLTLCYNFQGIPKQSHSCKKKETGGARAKNWRNGQKTRLARPNDCRSTRRPRGRGGSNAGPGWVDRAAKPERGFAGRASKVSGLWPGTTRRVETGNQDVRRRSKQVWKKYFVHLCSRLQANDAPKIVQDLS